MNIAHGEPVADAESLVERIYDAFNRRDIDGALAFMADNVSWPKASEGGRVKGKEAIRAYWTRQWAEFDPHVEPVALIDYVNGEVHVRVHQMVKSLPGELLFDGEVWHIYSIANGLIERMELGQDGVQEAPSEAFSRRA